VKQGILFDLFNAYQNVEFCEWYTNVKAAKVNSLKILFVKEDFFFLEEWWWFKMFLSKRYIKIIFF